VFLSLTGHAALETIEESELIEVAA
jgi:hypothetical protein